MYESSFHVQIVGARHRIAKAGTQGTLRVCVYPAVARGYEAAAHCIHEEETSMRIRHYLSVVAVGGLFVAAASSALEDPNLRAAQRELKTAASYLQAAPDDPGGYRKRAASFVNEALEQVHRALESGYRPESRRERLEQKEYKREEQLEEKAEKRNERLDEKAEKRNERLGQ
jgi:hypothetical protein